MQQGIRWYYCRNTSSRSTIRPLYLFEPAPNSGNRCSPRWLGTVPEKEPGLSTRPISRTCIRDTHSLHFVRLSDLFLLFR